MSTNKNKPKDNTVKSNTPTQSQLDARQQALKAQEDKLNKQQQVQQTKDQQLKAKEKALTEFEAKLNKQQQHIDVQRLEAENGFPKLLEMQFGKVKAELELSTKANNEKWQQIEQKSEQLRLREVEVTQAEMRLEQNFSDERKAFNIEMSESRQASESELSRWYHQQLTQLESELSREREQRFDALSVELQQERERVAKELALDREVFTKSCDTMRANLNSQSEELKQLQAKLDSQTEQNTYDKNKLESFEERLEQREQQLDEEVDDKIDLRIASFKAKEKRLEEESIRLREDIEITSTTLSLFEQLKHQLGDEDPHQLLVDLKTLREENNHLLRELTERPTEQMRSMFDNLKAEKKVLERHNGELKAKNIELVESAQQQDQLEMEIEQLEEKNRWLYERQEDLETKNNFLTEELKRQKSAFKRKKERKKRIADIQRPHFTDFEQPLLYEISEMQWLEGIEKACIDYGLKFPQRILYAFHTALKTAEWSPLTILSGVSGTGKSELPKLYSHFGGIKFLNLAVQPNWDSQESMLGFFNAIDNKFDAQPVLQLLAQSQLPFTEDYPYGLKDGVSLVLLDEMNLAYVELYFAEFLSKLELRRGKRKTDLPVLDVKLGAGVEPYPLPLGRNILWAGTMNQDETTKSLSDKVLDRAIAIHFPRPVKLERRQKLKPLDQQAPLLHQKTWGRWWNKDVRFTEQQLKPFKPLIEKINGYLAVIGRALGHRVWQSIEYYMANYPTVRALEKYEITGERGAESKQWLGYSDEKELTKQMRIAFEDQLVQKVMPKLRGIETRGTSKTECLDKIEQLLLDNDYAIVEDFKRACELGYGQFVWCSADYLNEPEPQVSNEASQMPQIEEDKQHKEKDGKKENSQESDIDKLKAYCKKQHKILNKLTYQQIMGVLKIDQEAAKAIKAQLKQAK